MLSMDSHNVGSSGPTPPITGSCRLYLGRWYEHLATASRCQALLAAASLIDKGER